MNYEDVAVKFAGFEPTDDVLLIINSFMNILYHRSPSQSSLSAKFTKTDDVFEGVVTIESSVINITANAIGGSISGLRQSLSKELFTSLTEWQLTRFTRETVQTKVA